MFKALLDDFNYYKDGRRNLINDSKKYIDGSKH